MDQTATVVEGAPLAVERGDYEGGVVPCCCDGVEPPVGRPYAWCCCHTTAPPIPDDVVLNAPDNYCLCCDCCNLCCGYTLEDPFCDDGRRDTEFLVECETCLNDQVACYGPERFAEWCCVLLPPRCICSHYSCWFGIFFFWLAIPSFLLVVVLWIFLLIVSTISKTLSCYWFWDFFNTPGVDQTSACYPQMCCAYRESNTDLNFEREIVLIGQDPYTVGEWSTAGCNICCLLYHLYHSPASLLKKKDPAGQAEEQANGNVPEGNVVDFINQ